MFHKAKVMEGPFSCCACSCKKGLRNCWSWVNNQKQTKIKSLIFVQEWTGKRFSSFPRAGTSGDTCNTSPRTHKAQKCVDTTWITRYGVSATIISDQGHQFTAALGTAYTQQQDGREEPWAAYGRTESHPWTVASGRHTFTGSFWDVRKLQRRKVLSLLQSWCLEQPCLFWQSSSLVQGIRQNSSWSRYGRGGGGGEGNAGQTTTDLCRGGTH